MPMVVEIVDLEEKLRGFAQSLGGLRHIGLATLERVEVLTIPAGHRGRPTV